MTDSRNTKDFLRLAHWTRRFGLVFAASVVVCFVQEPILAQAKQSAQTPKAAPASKATGKAHQPVDVCAIPSGPDALWALAKCCSKTLSGNRDCREYDPRYDYIILKDNAPTKTDSYMIIPTRRVTGIEDRLVFSMPFLDFWEYGWERSRQYPGVAAWRTGMAINSARSRSQNQLHIHISCVRSDVSKILAENDKEIGTYPTEVTMLQMPPHNNTYRVLKVSRLSGDRSPFIVIQAIPSVAMHMAEQSIAVVGSHKRDEYYVLETYYHGADSGAAEELLDESCKGGG